MEELGTPAFWLAALEVIAINIVLSGDNAVVIALACRNLSPEYRRKGMFLGIAGAVVLRVVLTAFAVGLLALPYLKLVGGALLIWIGIKLQLPEEGGGEEVRAREHFWGAVKTIIVADCVMSLDNVIGVAAAAHDNLLLLLFGLGLSIPLIIWASQQIMGLMVRFPVLVTLGAGLLGYVAGDMLVADAAWREAVAAAAPRAGQIVGALAAATVVGVGLALARRAEARSERRIL